MTEGRMSVQRGIFQYMALNAAAAEAAAAEARHALCLLLLIMHKI